MTLPEGLAARTFLTVIVVHGGSGQNGDKQLNCKPLSGPCQGGLHLVSGELPAGAGASNRPAAIPFYPVNDFKAAFTGEDKTAGAPCVRSPGSSASQTSTIQ